MNELVKKRSSNNKYELEKEGLLHRMDKLKKKIESLPIEKKEIKK